MLEKDNIYYIYQKVCNLAKQYNRHARYHIDTNGTIPFDDLYQNMDNLHVAISLSMKDDHNLNRPGNGFDSYDCIIHNLDNLNQKKKNSLSIRYNTNDKNIYQFEEFVKYIHKNISICEWIEPMYTDEYSYNEFKNYLPLEKFKVWNSKEAVDIMIQNGYKCHHALRQSLNMCVAYQDYSCKVYADGIVTLCDSMFHNVSTTDISEICNSPNKLQQLFSEYKNYNPIEDEKCRDCMELYISVKEKPNGKCYTY